jgi:exodeoxyribonuclease-1
MPTLATPEDQGSMQTYLFYDIETTGTNKAFDQILQFAAIRTDLELNELARHEFNIKLNPDVNPAPGATITHQITIAESLTGAAEIEAIQQIHKIVNEPGTISLGYNTLGFDDEFLRFAFFRNLLPPYTHQYANQCGRMDLYPMTVIYSLFNPGVMEWPVIENRRSLKLEHINQANHFIEGRSHLAMVDVEVTLELARRLIKAREMWDYLIANFQKPTELQRLQKLPLLFDKYPEGLMIAGKFGARNNYQSPVIYLGDSIPYAPSALWLRLDTPELATTTAETIGDATWVVRKKAGEPPFILPPVERFMTHLSHERQEQTAANKKWLQENPELLEKIISYHRQYTYPYFPGTDVEASLYLDGFWSNQENDFCRRFHAATPPEKSRLAETISNLKLKVLVIRLLGRHYPDVLTSAQRQLYEDFRNLVETSAIIDFKGNQRLTARQALAKCAEYRQSGSLSDKQLLLLDELEIYLAQKIRH